MQRLRLYNCTICGRTTHLYRWKQLAELLNLLSWTDGELPDRDNVAPTQSAPVVRSGERGREGTMMRWGLVPAWAEGLADGARNFNARAETVATKPSFREAFKRRRCIVPVSGFYEWRVLREGRKQPHYVTRKDREPFMLAGLWERWDGPRAPELGAGPVETFTILTTTPNALMKPLHDRMPVILQRPDWDRWLASDPLHETEASRLFTPADDHDFEAFPVGSMVSNARNEGPELTRKVPGIDPDEGFLF